MSIPAADPGDRAEQELDAAYTADDPEVAVDEESADLPEEADPADVSDQRRPVPEDEEEGDRG
jgi:hypothetical protein